MRPCLRKEKSKKKNVSIPIFLGHEILSGICVGEFLLLWGTQVWNVWMERFVVGSWKKNRGHLSKLFASSSLRGGGIFSEHGADRVLTAQLVRLLEVMDFCQTRVFKKAKFRSKGLHNQKAFFFLFSIVHLER